MEMPPETNFARQDRRGAEAAVWTASVIEAHRLPGGLAILDEDERARVRRLRKAADRERFLAARMLLRHVLSKAAGGQVRPDEWRYRDGLNGKPMVALDLPPIEFNLSHAGECVAAGISRSAPIGVDVESLSPEDCPEIIDDVLTERERHVLHALPPDRRPSAFVRLWTIKEACAKALALGVDLDFAMLDAGLDPPCFVKSDGFPAGAEAFDVATKKIVCMDRTYFVTAARASTAAGGTQILFRSLTE